MDMKRHFRYVLCIIAITIFGGIGTLAHAQVPAVGLQETIETTVIPKFPRAHEEVTLQVTSYTSDFDRANIAWFVDGTRITERIGQRAITFTTGAVGETTTIRMVAQTVSGATVERFFRFIPGDVDLVWEAESYAPAFYEGKRLHPPSGTIRIIALPDLRTPEGAHLSPDNLVYTWTVDRTIRPALSGFGKNSIRIGKDDTYKSNLLVTVEVTSLTNDAIAQESVIINPTQPFILFYEESPLLGLQLNKALNNGFNLEREEVQIVAEPYFFSIANKRDSNLAYTWLMNGTRITETDPTPGKLTLRNTATGTGKSRLTLRLQHNTLLFQGAQGNTTISFGTARNSLFSQ